MLYNVLPVVAQNLLLSGLNKTDERSAIARSRNLVGYTVGDRAKITGCDFSDGFPSTTGHPNATGWARSPVIQHVVWSTLIFSLFLAVYKSSPSHLFFIWADINNLWLNYLILITENCRWCLKLFILLQTIFIDFIFTHTVPNLSFRL